MSGDLVKEMEDAADYWEFETPYTADVLRRGKDALEKQSAELSALLSADEARVRDISRLTIERDAAIERADHLTAELAAAREALEPFAETANHYLASGDDHKFPDSFWVYAELGACRRARAILSVQKEGG